MDSFTYRRDIRSNEEFADDIRRTTTAEHHWGVALQYDFCERFGPCRVEESGVDNSGEVIVEKLPNYNADKKYVFGPSDETLVEICGHQTVHYHADLYFATFKVDKLQRLASCTAVDNIIMPILDVYYVFGPEAAEHILNRLPPVMGPKSWGYKEVIQINRTNLSGCQPTSLSEMEAANFIAVHKWLPQAQAYVFDHADILYAPRKNRSSYG